MKRFFFVLMTIATLILLLDIGFDVYDHFKGDDFKKRFDKIRNGMKVREVTDIIGKPVQINYDSIAHTSEYCYSSGIIGKSTEPYIVFDSSNTVIQAVYGD